MSAMQMSKISLRSIALAVLTALPVAALAAPPLYPAIELQARTNLLINDNGYNLPPGASFNSITVDLNDEAEVTFRVQVVPGFDGMSVWFGAHGAGSLVCNSDNDIEAIISDPRVNNAGSIVFSQFFAAANNGIWLCDALAHSAARLTAAPLGATSWGTPELNESGQIGYRAGFSSGSAWVSYAGGGVAIHAAENAIDAGSPYNFLFTPSFDNLRRIAGVVRVAAAAPVVEHREVRLFDSTGASSLIAIDRSGNAASPYIGFDNGVGLSNNGTVAFVATLDGNVRSVQRGSASGVVEIARVGVGGITEIEFFAPAINDSGLVVFRGRDANGQAIFVGDGSILRRVIGKGDAVATDLGAGRVGQHDDSPVFGGGVAINAEGTLAFTAALHPNGDTQTEWGTGVFVAYANNDILFADGFE